MEALLRAAGVTEESIEQARAALGKQLRATLDEFVEDTVRRTLALPGYETIQADQVRANARHAIQTVLDTLDGADYGLYGSQLQEVAERRAKQGLPSTSMFALADMLEQMLGELGASCLQGAVEILSGAIVARRVSDGGRRVVIEAFNKANSEARADVERLARQFSAPILPALPGVLVLPIVGAISTARASQIIEALLGGITRHAAHTAIIDITGITDVDASLSGHLLRATLAARMLGARVLLVGVTPAVATLLVRDADGLGAVTIHRTLAAALLSASFRELLPSSKHL